MKILWMNLHEWSCCHKMEQTFEFEFFNLNIWTLIFEFKLVLEFCNFNWKNIIPSLGFEPQSPSLPVLFANHWPHSQHLVLEKIINIILAWNFFDIEPPIMGWLKKLPFEGGQVLRLFKYWKNKYPFASWQFSCTKNTRLLNL